MLLSILLTLRFVLIFNINPLPGPNHAADPIVMKSVDGDLYCVVIQRKDTKEWALPGGMVDFGERVSATVQREFQEEALNIDQATLQTFKADLDTMFEQGEDLYRGYVDDPRNTDNAWMETVAVLFRCSDTLASHIVLNAGDDAQKMQWMKCDPSSTQFQALYASHQAMVLRAMKRYPRPRVQTLTEIYQDSKKEAEQDVEEVLRCKTDNPACVGTCAFSCVFVMWLILLIWGQALYITLSYPIGMTVHSLLTGNEEHLRATLVDQNSKDSIADLKSYSYGLSDAVVVLGNKDGIPLVERFGEGHTDYTVKMALASASKWVTAVIIYAVIEDPTCDLTSASKPVDEFDFWPKDDTRIGIKDLMGFADGLPNAGCEYTGFVPGAGTWLECIEKVSWFLMLFCINTFVSFLSNH